MTWEKSQAGWAETWGDSHLPLILQVMSGELKWIHKIHIFGESFWKAINQRNILKNMLSAYMHIFYQVSFHKMMHTDCSPDSLWPPPTDNRNGEAEVSSTGLAIRQMASKETFMFFFLSPLYIFFFGCRVKESSEYTFVCHKLSLQTIILKGRVTYTVLLSWKS